MDCKTCGAFHEPVDGIYELLPPGAGQEGNTFDTFYGALYDAGVQARRLAPLAGWLMWGADLERVYREMAEGIACRPGQIVLDLPTGGGVTFAPGSGELKGLLIGVDLSRGMLLRAARRRRRARLRGRVMLAHGDGANLPLLDASVDRALCFNSLHCIPNKRAVLRELRRVLRPGGELIGTSLVLDAPAPWRVNIQLARLGGFFHPVTGAELRRLAKAAGFARWRQERAGAVLHFRGQ